MLQDDLWGELPSANNTPMPVAILRQQARLLTDKSGGVLEGVVMLAPENFQQAKI